MKKEKMKESIFFKIMVVLFLIGCCSCAGVEQMVSLPGHYTLGDIGAVSFPSSSVHIVNTSIAIVDPFHVICIHLGSVDVPSTSRRTEGARSGQMECVSSLDDRGLYVYGTLSDSCFAEKSADARFVIVTPVIGNNNCVLDAVISEQPGLLERAFNPKVENSKVSQWSIDAAQRVPRVNAYERVVEIMKRHHVDFKNQILLNEDLPVSFRDFYDMIVSDIAGGKEDTEGVENVYNPQQAVDNIKHVFHQWKQFSNEWSRVHRAVLQGFRHSGFHFGGVIQDTVGKIAMVWNSVIKILTLNGQIPIGTYVNPFVLLFGFCIWVAAMWLFVFVLCSFLAIVKPLAAITAAFIIFLILIK